MLRALARGVRQWYCACALRRGPRACVQDHLLTWQPTTSYQSPNPISHLTRSHQGHSSPQDLGADWAERPAHLMDALHCRPRRPVQGLNHSQWSPRSPHLPIGHFCGTHLYGSPRRRWLASFCLLRGRPATGAGRRRADGRARSAACGGGSERGVPREQE